MASRMLASVIRPRPRSFFERFAEIALNAFKHRFTSLLRGEKESPGAVEDRRLLQGVNHSL